MGFGYTLLLYLRREDVKMKNIELLNNLQYSFATALWSIMISDKIVSQKEQKKFNTFLKNEFLLTSTEIKAMFEKVQNSTKESISEHLELLKEALKNHPVEKARFMKYLNECIICDGVDDREYQTFEEIRERLF
jgi:uncharacterized tellurite resistance protein B-like protein